MSIPKKTPSTEITPQTVLEAMRRVADWQLAHPSPHSTLDWTHGALFAGMTAWGMVAEEPRYLDWLIHAGKKNNWQPGPQPYLADDHCVGWMYLELFNKYRDARMMKPVEGRFNWILKHPSQASLEFGSPQCHDRWCWCDALFMSPPVWTRLAALTGRKDYLDFMNTEWWATTDFLYDREENLFFRDSRFFKKREKNGRKVFWGRGNGWVMAGLVRVLQHLPADYPDRPKYLALFQEMAAKIASLQSEDGLWRSSLLDSGSFPAPETSGSGFFCYALAWGINQGILDRRSFLPPVKKAWQGLVQSVHPDGKLGWVQQVGEAPARVTAEETEIFGVGGLLLAGTEIHKIALLSNG